MDFSSVGISLFGGVLIGLSSAGVLITQGRVAGVSNICGGLLRPGPGDLGWRVGFILGLGAVGLIGAHAAPARFDLSAVGSMPNVILAGLLVGFGTRLSNGCTSGHGVCGVARLSKRSIAATLTFMATGALSVFLVRHVLGGGR